MSKTYFLCLIVCAIVIIREIKNYTPSEKTETKSTEKVGNQVTGTVVGVGADGTPVGVNGGGGISWIDPDLNKADDSKKTPGKTSKKNGYTVVDPTANIPNVRAN